MKTEREKKKDKKHRGDKHRDDLEREGWEGRRYKRERVRWRKKRQRWREKKRVRLTEGWAESTKSELNKCSLMWERLSFISLLL